MFEDVKQKLRSVPKRMSAEEILDFCKKCEMQAVLDMDKARDNGNQIAFVHFQDKHRLFQREIPAFIRIMFENEMDTV